MREYTLEIKQIVDYPRCRIYRQFVQALIADRSIRVSGGSGLFYFVVLCAYANFRTSYKRIDGISYTIYPGEWIMSVEELSRYFRTRFRRQTLAALEGLQKKGLISFLVLGHGKLVKFKIRGWRRHNTILDYNAPCQKDTGFFFFPVSTATELVSAGHCSEMDAVLDLWLNTVYNDPQVLGSDVGPVVYLRNGTGCPLVSYAELASRWGVSKATAGRYLKRMAERGYLQLAAFPGTHGTTIYLQNYLSTMFQISDIVVDKEEIAMSLGIKLELQEETALTTTVTSGSNETGSVSEMNRHRIERKMREILVAQGLPCASCPKSKYMLLPLSDDCEVTIEGGPPLRRWLQLVVTCGDAQEVYHFELRLHPTGMRGDMAADALMSYMGYTALGEGAADIPTFSNVEIGGGHITGTETSEEEPDGRAFAMYSTEQYMEPKREYTTVTTVDGAKWYRQYAQDIVEKKPYQNPDGGISYRESLIRRLPDPPRRKDKT